MNRATPELRSTRRWPLVLMREASPRCCFMPPSIFRRAANGDSRIDRISQHTHVSPRTGRELLETSCDVLHRIETL